MGKAQARTSHFSGNKTHSIKGKQSRPAVAKRYKRTKQQTPALIFGIDWSGAADAGKKILVAECTLKIAGHAKWVLSVLQVRPASALPGGGVKPEEASAALCAELQSKAGKHGELIVGIDSPPSIAAQFVKSSNWQTWAMQFSSNFPTPESFRKATSIPALRKGARTEPKRETDIRCKTPFPPQNLRMYKQTWWAIRGVYAPLASSGFAVVPCVKPLPNKPLIFEACPASLLKRLGLYSIPYKGSQAERGKRRKYLISQLTRGVPIGGSSDATLQVEFCNRAIAPMLIADTAGDSLDAVLAAVGSACATRRAEFPAPDDGEMLDIYKVEACVYC